MARRTRTLTPALAVAALAAVVAIGGAGCGSSGGEDATSGAGATTASTKTTKKLGAREKAVKFSVCVRAHGVPDFPDPNADNDFDYGISVSPEVWTRAVDACKDLQPPGTLSADRTPEEQARGLQFARCIRANGVKDFPDPVEGEPLVDTRKIPSSNAPGGMTILNAAMEKCGDLGPKR